MCKRERGVSRVRKGVERGWRGDRGMGGVDERAMETAMFRQEGNKLTGSRKSRETWGCW